MLLGVTALSSAPLSSEAEAVFYVMDGASGDDGAPAASTRIVMIQFGMRVRDAGFGLGSRSMSSRSVSHSMAIRSGDIVLSCRSMVIESLAEAP